MDSAPNYAGSVFGKDVSPGDFRKYLVYLLLLGLIVRAGFLVEHAHSPSFGVPTLDQKYYDTVARMLLAGDDLHQLRGMRPLLYPMFLAALYKIGGSHGIDLAVITQHLLGVLTGLLVACLGARLFRHRLSGIIAGVLYLLAPVPLNFEGELLIEPSYILLICLGLLLILRAAEVAGAKAALLWLLSGALTILTAQARPNILIFMAVYPLFAVWRWWHLRQNAALLPLLALAGAIAMGIPWGFVNKMQSDHFQIIPSAGGVNLYFGNKRSADGMEPEQGRRVTYGERYEDSGEVWAREECAAAMRAEGRQPDLSPMNVSKYWTDRALDEIKADPAAWLGLEIRKCWLMLWNAEIPNNKSFAFLQTEFLWLRFLPIRWVILLMLAPVGIWAAARWGNRDALFVLLAYLAIYASGNVLFFICDRYRYPLWPVMAAIAGGGVFAFVQSFHRTRRELLGLTAAMALMAVLSLPNWFGVKLPSFARDYLFRSIASYEKGQFPQALADVDHSLALDPGEVTALHHRGNVLLALGQFGDACQSYEQALKSAADDAGIWNNYANALDGVGQTNAALQAFHHAITCTPPSQSAFLGLAFDLVRLGRLDEAAATLDQSNDTGAVALALRSVLARKHNDTAQADTLEKQARAIDPAATDWAIKRAGE